MTVSVHLEAITKTYGPVTAVCDVHLDVHEGELTALLGPSGCGKTTLLRVVAGLVLPDRGRVRFGGADVTRVPTRQRPIGMVFQHYALFPNMTVARNVAFPLRTRRMDKAAVARRVGEMLELVGLGGFEHRYPNELSGGQQQRVALARALAPEPKVLLLDEPLSALDAVIRANLRDEIRRIQRRVGTTALFVTHDQSEAMALADTVAVMAAGAIEEVAPPAKIWEAPSSRVAATFIGGRNVLELPTTPDRWARWGDAFAVPVPDHVNGSVLAVFRPTDTEVVAEGGVGAVVEVRAFLGASTRLQLRAETGHVVAAELPSHAAAHLHEGAEVRLRVDPARVQVFRP